MTYSQLSGDKLTFNGLYYQKFTNELQSYKFRHPNLARVVFTRQNVNTPSLLSSNEIVVLYQVRDFGQSNFVA